MVIQKNPSDNLEARAAALGEVWGRLPRPGQRLEGMSRSYLYELIKAGKIRSHVIRKGHCVRGIRLLHVPSIRAFIAAQADEAAPF
jgi:hypothetical protein